jgi:hypothetical protein
MNQSIILDGLYSNELAKDDFISLSLVFYAQVDSVSTIISMIAEALVPLIISDSKAGK